jgi:hypothetical protein
VSTTSGGWYGLLAIVAECIAEHQAAATATPVACPNDGEPLEPGGSRGGLHCPYDGYRTNA